MFLSTSHFPFPAMKNKTNQQAFLQWHYLNIIMILFLSFFYWWTYERSKCSNFLFLCLSFCRQASPVLPQFSEGHIVPFSWLVWLPLGQLKWRWWIPGYLFNKYLCRRCLKKLGFVFWTTFEGVKWPQIKKLKKKDAQNTNPHFFRRPVLISLYVWIIVEII